MAQQQGSSSTTSGRIGAEIGTAAAAANVALGAGWGNSATLAIRSGSNDQAGAFTVTSAGTGQAQATATITFTFADGAYAAAPRSYIVQLVNSSNAVTETGATAATCSTTALAWAHSVLPVATKTYQYNYLVIA
jgi:hypothetical protein